MLDENVTLSYSDDGIAAATAKVFRKRAHEVNRAEYRNVTVINDPSLPDHRFVISTTDPKTTKDFYGTRRVGVNLRRESSVPIPNGEESRMPCVFKFEASIPVGVDGAEIEGDIAWIRAFINHDVFKRVVKTLET